jgi:hypothetical protein
MKKKKKNSLDSLIPKMCAKSPRQPSLSMLLCQPLVLPFHHAILLSFCPSCPGMSSEIGPAGKGGDDDFVS